MHRYSNTVKILHCNPPASKFVHTRFAETNTNTKKNSKYTIHSLQRLNSGTKWLHTKCEQTTKQKCLIMTVYAYNYNTPFPGTILATFSSRYSW